MTHELTPIDIRRVPELAHLVDEVTATGRPRRIMRDNEDIAVLLPAAPKRRRTRDWRPSPKAVEAAVALAGAWRDQLDPETFKRERRELQIDDKPPRNL